METKVVITEDESNMVHVLFSRFCSYMNMLGFLAQYGSVDTNLFDKKWEEAILLNQQLEQIKQELDNKYHPHDGNEYKEYHFDFNNHTMVYIL